MFGGEENNISHVIDGEEKSNEHVFVKKRTILLMWVGRKKNNASLMTGGDENNTTQVNVGKENNVVW